MFRTSLFGALALTLSVATTAQADFSADVAGALNLVGDRHAVPPQDQKGQWLTDPKKCETFRSPRVGEYVGYLMINSARPVCSKNSFWTSPYDGVH